MPDSVQRTIRTVVQVALAAVLIVSTLLHPDPAHPFAARAGLRAPQPPYPTGPVYVVRVLGGDGVHTSLRVTPRLDAPHGVVVQNGDLLDATTVLSPTLTLHWRAVLPRAGGAAGYVYAPNVTLPEPAPTATATTIPPPTGTAPPTAPTAYAPLYATVSAQVAALGTALAVPTVTTAPTTPLVHGAELLLASGSRGADLLTPSVMIGIDRELDALVRVGVQGVTVHIPYPILLPTEADDAGYVAFYQQVAQDVRARGLALVVAQGNANAAIAPGSPFPAFTYPAFCTYEAQQHQIVQRIVDIMAPTWLSLFDEPTSWYAATGYSQFDPKGGTAGALAYLRSLLGSAADPACPTGTVTALQKGGTRVVSGQGNWESTAYAAGDAGLADLDGINLHVYIAISSTAHPYAAAVPTVAAIAHVAGKAFVLTEAWPNKQQENELRVVPFAVVQARSVFSFWAPVDSAFVQTMATFAAGQGASYLSVSYSGYFDSYLDYASGTYDETTAPATLQRAAGLAQDANRKSHGPFTHVGVTYCQHIAGRSGTPCLALQPWPTVTPAP